MIGLPDGLASLRDLGLVGQVAGPVERRGVEAVDRTQVGDALPRIEAGAIGRPVQVDDVARVGGDQHRGAQFVREVVQALQVPVGVGHLARLICEARRELRRHVGADLMHYLIPLIDLSSWWARRAKLPYMNPIATTEANAAPVEPICGTRVTSRTTWQQQSQPGSISNGSDGGTSGTLAPRPAKYLPP